jgi:hypothetical protein
MPYELTIMIMAIFVIPSILAALIRVGRRDVAHSIDPAIAHLIVCIDPSIASSPAQFVILLKPSILVVATLSFSVGAVVGVRCK